MEPGILAARFDTAWSPPIRFYEFMKVLGFEVIACYAEFGHMICGSFTTAEGVLDGYEAHHEAKCAICKILGQDLPTQTIKVEFSDLAKMFLGIDDDVEAQSKCHFCEKLWCSLPKCVRCNNKLHRRLFKERRPHALPRLLL